MKEDLEHYEEKEQSFKKWKSRIAEVQFNIVNVITASSQPAGMLKF